jgi:hypothetical protein
MSGVVGLLAVSILVSVLYILTHSPLCCYSIFAVVLGGGCTSAYKKLLKVFGHTL